jgi:hypothetical protein
MGPLQTCRRENIGYLADVVLGASVILYGNAEAQGARVLRPTGKGTRLLDGARSLHPEGTLRPTAFRPLDSSPEGFVWFAAKVDSLAEQCFPVIGSGGRSARWHAPDAPFMSRMAVVLNICQMADVWKGALP